MPEKKLTLQNARLARIGYRNTYPTMLSHTEGPKFQCIGFAMSNLLDKWSQNNSLMKHVVGVYMYVSGASHQLISVMSSIGNSSSYITIAGSGRQDKNALMAITDILDDSDDKDPDWLLSLSLDDELDNNDHYDIVEDKSVDESTAQENDKEQVVRRPSCR